MTRALSTRAAWYGLLLAVVAGCAGARIRADRVEVAADDATTGHTHPAQAFETDRDFKAYLEQRDDGAAAAEGEDCDVLVDGEPIRWCGPSAGGDGPWPALFSDVVWIDGDTLRVEVRNHGAGEARGLSAVVSNDVGGHRLYLGDVAPNALSHRHISFRGDAAMPLTVTFESPRALTPAPARTVYLPRTVDSAQAFDRLAQQVFDDAVALLRDRLGDQTFAPTLHRLPDGAIGYMYSALYDRVSYQNAYTLEGAGLATNQALAQVHTRARLLRNAELQHYVYL